MTIEAQSKVAALYWDHEGQIACEQHAPGRGTDTWRLDRWEPMGPDSVAIFTDEVGRAPECECCAAIARRERP